MASTKISRNMASNSNSGKLTISVWLKRNSLGEKNITTSYYNGAYHGNFYFNPSDQLSFYDYRNGYLMRRTTTRKFRDINAWYHIVANFDHTISSPTAQIWVNGEEITDFSNINNYSQGATSSWLTDYQHDIGAYNTSYHHDGVMADYYFIQGYKYDASTFGETDATTGQWKPILNPTINYSSTGGNSCHLKFENSANMDLDSGDNNLTFTTSGTLTQTKDTPSNNFATLNSLTADCTLSNGSTTWVGTTSGYEHSSATLGASSGKYYWEVKPNGACGAMGVTDFNWQFERRGSIIYASSGYAWVYEGNGYVSHDSYGDIATNYSSYGSSDIIGVALDLDNNKLYFHKNGTYENSGDPTSGSTGTGAISIDAPSTLPSGFYSPLVADLCSATAGGGSVNFGNGYFGTTAISSEGTNASGNGKFEYDVPTGYTALSTKGLNT